MNMKALLSTLLLTAAATAQTAAPLDADTATKSLSRKVVKTGGSDDALTKSAAPDPEMSRTYDLTKNIVVRKKKSGAVETLPFEPLPVLFKKDSDELLDAVSEENLKKLASSLKAVIGQEKAVRFQIEGHASAEGEDAHNLTLSQRRAARIRELLTGSLGVEAGVLKSQGFGEKHAAAAEDAPEAQRQHDRVVRVVKTR